MTLEVIGAGMPRTGTESLKLALEQLGFSRCYHMIELIGLPHHQAQWEAAARGEAVDFDALFEGFRAAVDFPAMMHWELLAARYPAARVVLTVREPAGWVQSLEQTILDAVGQVPQDDPETAARRAMVRRDLLGRVFRDQAHDGEAMMRLFAAHTEHVRNTLPPERLLVFDVREGWAPLCRFLERPLPDTPFPRTNSTAQFRQRFLGEAPRA